MAPSSETASARPAPSDPATSIRRSPVPGTAWRRAAPQSARSERIMRWEMGQEVDPEYHAQITKTVLSSSRTWSERCRARAAKPLSRRFPPCRPRGSGRAVEVAERMAVGAVVPAAPGHAPARGSGSEPSASRYRGLSPRQAAALIREEDFPMVGVRTWPATLGSVRGGISGAGGLGRLQPRRASIQTWAARYRSIRSLSLIMADVPPGTG